MGSLADYPRIRWFNACLQLKINMSAPSFTAVGAATGTGLPLVRNASIAGESVVRMPLCRILPASVLSSSRAEPASTMTSSVAQFASPWTYSNRRHRVAYQL
jgi:hypothetical protein